MILCHRLVFIFKEQVYPSAQFSMFCKNKLSRCDFLQEMLTNIKHVTFTALSTTKNRTLTTSYFRPVNIAKFLRTAFLSNSSRSSRLQMFFKIVVLKSFANFTGKHLCWSLFKNLQAEDLQLHKKSLQHRCFLVKTAKFLRKVFLTEHLR